MGIILEKPFFKKCLRCGASSLIPGQYSVCEFGEDISHHDNILFPICPVEVEATNDRVCHLHAS